MSGISHLSRRPPPADRRFTSARIDELIREVCLALPNREIAWLFENCFPNTLDTTVFYNGDGVEPDTFIITGDIDAMWLRDSCAQIWPYLPYIQEDPKLDLLFQGTIHRQVRCILRDPYANAFYADDRESPWHNDKTEMRPGVHERKWEIDSLAYFLRLSYGYWKKTGSSRVFGEKWQNAVKLCCQTIAEQMDATTRANYRFQRLSEISTETLPLSGVGNPIRTCGLVASGFRPSDDACIFPYLIPSNAMMVVSLHQAGLMLDALGLSELAKQCERLSKTIDAGIKEWGVGSLGAGPVYFYEVDGFGSRLFMDDANIPSLLSLPYLGYVPQDDATYLNTRSLVWSKANPYFFQGQEFSGIGGPHVGLGYIWPMSLMMYALTSQSASEKRSALRSLLKSHGGTGFMHESFHKDRPEDYTRSWFGWANSLFGELILSLYREHPDVFKNL